MLNPLHSFRAASGRAVLIFFEFEAAPRFQLFLLSSSAGWSSLVQHIYFSIRPFLPYFNKTWASYQVPRDKNMGIAFTPSCNKSGVEWYGPAQFARQFGLMQMVPLLPLTSLNSELSSRIDLTQSHRSMVEI